METFFLQVFIGRNLSYLDAKQLIKLLLSNLRMEEKKIVYDVQKPFDLMVKTTDDINWRYLVDAFRRGEVCFDISLSHIQTAFSELGIKINFY